MLAAKLKNIPVVYLHFDLERVSCHGICFCAYEYEKRTQNQIVQELIHRGSKPDISYVAMSYRPSTFSELYHHILYIAACSCS